MFWAEVSFLQNLRPSLTYLEWLYFWVAERCILLLEKFSRLMVFKTVNYYLLLQEISRILTISLKKQQMFLSKLILHCQILPSFIRPDKSKYCTALVFWEGLFSSHLRKNARKHYNPSTIRSVNLERKFWCLPKNRKKISAPVG